MTVRQVYEGTLIEMNKVQAPSLLLEDFNYLFNKAIYQYVNKRYNIYDINQQTSDDIRVLKATVKLPAFKSLDYGAVTAGKVTTSNSLYGGTYEVNLPSDYLHILNCVCNFKVKKQFKCYDANTYVQFPATRLTADAWSQIINNFYMRPTYKRPYFYIHNVNINSTNPTNPYREIGSNLTYLDSKGESQTAYQKVINDEGIVTYEPIIITAKQGTDITSATYDESTMTTEVNSNIPRTITIGNTEVSNVERVGQIRYGNVSPVRMEIRYGKDNSLFELVEVYVDYLKTPQNVRLTQEQLDLTEDTSQMMEFPDYVCQEIINELVTLVMENASDPRLQTHIPVTQSIANPAQQQEKSK